MGITVRAVTDGDNKSQQEIERELIAQKEQEEAARAAAEAEAAAEDAKAAEAAKADEGGKPEITEELVLKFLSEKSGRQIQTIESLFQKEELPEDVDAILRYKKETGRGIADYMKLQRNVDSVKEDELLADYFLATETGLDESDIPAIMAEFQYDEEIDDEAHVRKAKLAKKQALSKAKMYFKEQTEKYKLPIEQIDKNVIRKDSDEYKAYQQWLEQTNQTKTVAEQRRGFFMKKTEELFNPEFKGFEFQIGEQKMTFTPGDPRELKALQSDPMNWVKKYIGEDGNIADVAGYHKALSVAMNPEKFAKHFYDQGVAKATEDVMARMKNVDMGQRQVTQTTRTGGLQIKAVSPESPFSGGLKIKQK